MRKDSLSAASLDCFASLAMTALTDFPLSCPRMRASSTPRLLGSSTALSLIFSTLAAIQLAAGFEHQLAQPDRAGVHLGAGRIEHELLVDAGVERRRNGC